IAMADFDADGRADLAVAGGLEKTVRLLSGKGDGRFVVKEDIALERYPGPLVVADVVGADGRLDIVVTNPDEDSLSVLSGSKGGKFAVDVVPGVPRPDAAVTADFNGDGRPDLAVALAADNSVGVWMGTVS